MAMNKHISKQSHIELSVQLQLYESVHGMNHMTKFNLTRVESRSMDFLKDVF